MNSSIVGSAILVLSAVVLSSASSAATFVVNSTLDLQDDRPGDGVCATTTATCTLRAAITEANTLAGADVITLPAGTYTTTLVSANEDGNLGGDFDINSDITINGVDPRTTFVQAATSPGVATERVFHLRYVAPGTTAVLSNMTIRHGRYIDTNFGAGVRVDGGAIVATFNGVTISDNHVDRSGGGIAIFNAIGSTTTLNGCRVEDNTSGGAGSIASNGAGILLDTFSATLNINNSRVAANAVSGNGTVSGGGIFSNGNLTITDSVILDNSATSSGADSRAGGIKLSGGTATIVNSRISGNAAVATAAGTNGQGGGIHNQVSLVLTNSIISQNSATLGGGLATTSANAPIITTITDSSIRDNTAETGGAGIGSVGIGSNAVTTNIARSTLTGNIVTAPTGFAGGLRNVSGTSANTTINVFNSTISGNISARGAGSYNQGTNATIAFDYSTIADNTATADGGGVLQGSTGSTTLTNSIVADNAAGTNPDVSGVVTSGGYNHVENVAGATFTLATGDVVGADPQLGALTNNGGITLTHLPAASSPVIDAIPFGISDCALVVTTSQNGLARPQQIGCEKGSVETDTNVIFQNGFDPVDETGIALVIASLGGGK